MANEAEQTIYERLAQAPTFHPASAALFADDWGLDAGDVVAVKRGDETYSVPVYSMTLDWRGDSMVEIESTGNQQRKPLSALKRRQYAGGRAGYRAKQEVEEMAVQYTQRFEVSDRRVASIMGATGVLLDENGNPVMVLNEETGEYEYAFDTTGQGASLASRVTQTAGMLQSEVTILKANDEALGSRITQTASEIRSEVANTASGLSSSISQEADRINAIVSAVGSGGQVTAASIVAAINSSGSSVTINADHINLVGVVTASKLDAELADVKMMFTEYGVGKKITGNEMSFTSGRVNDLTVGALRMTAGSGTVNIVRKAIKQYGTTLSDTVLGTGNDALVIPDGIASLRITSNSETGVYTLEKQTHSNSAWTPVGTFSRAVPTSLSGSWDGGVFTVTATPGDLSTTADLTLPAAMLSSNHPEVCRVTAFDNTVVDGVTRGDTGASANLYLWADAENVYIKTGSSGGGNTVAQMANPALGVAGIHDVTPGGWTNDGEGGGYYNLITATANNETEMSASVYLPTITINQPSEFTNHKKTITATGPVVDGTAYPVAASIIVDATQEYTDGQNSVDVVRDGDWDGGSAVYKPSVGTGKSVTVALTMNVASIGSGNACQVTAMDGEQSTGARTNLYLNIDTSGGKAQIRTASAGGGDVVATTDFGLEPAVINASTEGGILRPSEGKIGFSSITVNPARLQTSVVTQTDASHEYTPGDNYYGIGSLTVNVPQPSYQPLVVNASTDAQTLTPEEGYAGFSKVVVNSAKLRTMTETQTELEHTYTPGKNYYGIGSIKVTMNPEVNVIKGTWSGGKNAFSPSYGTGAVSYVELTMPITSISDMACRVTATDGNTDTGARANLYLNIDNTNHVAQIRTASGGAGDVVASASIPAGGGDVGIKSVEPAGWVYDSKIGLNNRKLKSVVTAIANDGTEKTADVIMPAISLGGLKLGTSGVTSVWALADNTSGTPYTCTYAKNLYLKANDSYCYICNTDGDPVVGTNVIARIDNPKDSAATTLTGAWDTSTRKYTVTAMPQNKKISTTVGLKVYDGWGDDGEGKMVQILADNNAIYTTYIPKPSPNLQTLETIKNNGTYSFDASLGYEGLNTVVVDVPNGSDAAITDIEVLSNNYVASTNKYELYLRAVGTGVTAYPERYSFTATDAYNAGKLSQVNLVSKDVTLSTRDQVYYPSGSADGFSDVYVPGLPSITAGAMRTSSTPVSADITRDYSSSYAYNYFTVSCGARTATILFRTTR